MDGPVPSWSTSLITSAHGKAEEQNVVQTLVSSVPPTKGRSSMIVPFTRQTPMCGIWASLEVTLSRLKFFDGLRFGWIRSSLHHLSGQRNLGLSYRTISFTPVVQCCYILIISFLNVGTLTYHPGFFREDGVKLRCVLLVEHVFPSPKKSRTYFYYL